MQRMVVTFLLTLMVLAPASQAQWITDDEDDQVEFIGPAQADHGRSGATDILAVDLEETEELVRFTVLHGELAANPTTLDSVGYRMEFLHGDAFYIIWASLNVPIIGGPQYSADLGTSNFGFLGPLDVEAIEGGFVVDVPKAMIPDHTGLIPTKGTSLTDFTIDARQRGSAQICIMECVTVGVTAIDHAPEAEQGARYDFQIGLAQEGDIRLSSPAPLRWSNGEATTYLYEVQVLNMGGQDDTVSFLASGVPAGWIVSDIPVTDVPANSEVTVPFAVQVPFGHKHGETSTFLVEALGQHGIGRIEMGVHYSDIPQPTGHHQQVFFHTRTTEVFVFEDLLYTAVGGAPGEHVFMNTLEDDDTDEGVPVQGYKNDLAESDMLIEGMPAVGASYQWAIPLAPDLRVGLQILQQTTDGSVDLEFDAPVGDVAVYGRLAAVPTGDLDQTFNFDMEVGETIGTIALTDTASIAGEVTMPFNLESEAQILEFDPDMELVLFLAADVLRPDAPLTPNTGVYLTGGDLVLPLAEYHDSIPVNMTFSEAQVEETIQQLDSIPTAEESQDAPGFGLVSMLAAIGIAAWRRNGLA